MPTYKTPGVYTEEISKFPPSVAEVATAVPAFIGYTERAERFGQNVTNVPTRIKSLLEYREIFGGEFTVPSFDVHLDEANGYAVKKVKPEKRFYMYEALRLYFDNGGGACYIVSVGPYKIKDAVNDVKIGDESAPATKPGLRVGLYALAKFDEPTIILFPDAAVLGPADFYAIQQKALDQSFRLMDRVALLDLREDVEPTVDFVQEFRDSIGINFLKYGAAYTPWLISAYPKDVSFASFDGHVKLADGTTALPLSNLDVDPQLNALVTAARTAVKDEGLIAGKLKALRTDTGPNPDIVYAAFADRYATLRRAIGAAATDADRSARLKDLIDFVRQVALDLPAWRAVENPELRNDVDAMALSGLRPAVSTLIALEKNAKVQVHTTRDDANVDQAYATYTTTKAASTPPQSWIATALADVKQDPDVDYTKDPTDATVTLSQPASVNRITKEVDAITAELAGFVEGVGAAAATRRDLAERTLYREHKIVRNIIDTIAREMARVPPSGAVAGVYAMVDRTRGVWKAPANVSLAGVIAPTKAYDYYDQEDLNIDVNGGKSINAIRAFTGAGVLIWGARTLAGNDNEWRYVPVRRFFNMVEESVKKSTGWAVFEPNDPNLWTKVKGMIDNYLIQKWRDGALVGPTADKAFFTHVGLGITMTAQDILEGRLIIEIGMAVVRPAEFIILRFSHKMQEA